MGLFRPMHPTCARLAGYKLSHSIDFEPELPRHPTGKLFVRQLRDRYWKGRGPRI